MNSYQGSPDYSWLNAITSMMTTVMAVGFMTRMVRRMLISPIAGSVYPATESRKALVQIPRSVFAQAVRFVADKLGDFPVRPKLVRLEDELAQQGLEPVDPWEPGAILAKENRYTGQVTYSGRVMSSRRDIQLAVLLHELAEMRYEQLHDSNPHRRAMEFLQKYGHEIGAATPKEVNEYLLAIGYYYAVADFKASTIPWEAKQPLFEKYGAWAVNLAESRCPQNDVDCVEREARILHETAEYRRALRA